MAKKSGAPAYLGILEELYTLIRRDYDEGGWLPPGRVLCEEMQANRGTYNKAISRLISEGLATSNRKGGTYIIPKHLRVHKIGVVFRDGVDCPFIGCSEAVSECFRVLFQEGQSLQIIQSGQLEHIGRQALLHNIDKLIWFFPHHSYIPIVRALEEKGISVMLVDPEYVDSEQHLEELMTVPHVWADRHGMGLSAELALQHGFRHPLYLGIPWVAEHWGLSKLFRDVGVPFSEKECFPKQRYEHKQLVSLIVRNEIDVIIAEGGFMRQQQLLETLSMLPEDVQQPAVILRHAGRVPQLKQTFPEVNIIGVLKSDHVAVGREAGRAMLAHVQTGLPLQSCAVPSYYIAPA